MSNLHILAGLLAHNPTFPAGGADFASNEARVRVQARIRTHLEALGRSAGLDEIEAALTAAADTYLGERQAFDALANFGRDPDARDDEDTGTPALQKDEPDDLADDDTDDEDDGDDPDEQHEDEDETDDGWTPPTDEETDALANEMLRRHFPRLKITV